MGVFFSDSLPLMHQPVNSRTMQVGSSLPLLQGVHMSTAIQWFILVSMSIGVALAMVAYSHAYVDKLNREAECTEATSTTDITSTTATSQGSINA